MFKTVIGIKKAIKNSSILVIIPTAILYSLSNYTNLIENDYSGNSIFFISGFILYLIKNWYENKDYTIKFNFNFKLFSIEKIMKEEIINETISKNSLKKENQVKIDQFLK